MDLFLTAVRAGINHQFRFLFRQAAWPDRLSAGAAEPQFELSIRFSSSRLSSLVDLSP